MRGIVAVCLGLCLGCQGEVYIDSESMEVVGGDNADISAFPWQVSLRSGGSHFCGGSIIKENWILTAAHCVVGKSPSGVKVLAGVTKLSQAQSGQTRNADAIYVYPGYNGAGNGRDAALVRVSTPFDLAPVNVEVIGTVTAEDATVGMTNPGVMATVSGWGALSANGGSPDTLQMLAMPIVSEADANQHYGSIEDDQLPVKASSQEGLSPCYGDSGGPLVVSADGKFKLAGIVSTGIDCRGPAPALYGRVSSFESFIRQHVFPPPPVALQNGAPLANQAAAKGAWLNYAIEVPAGATQLVIAISGDGDGDLYVRHGSAPTSSSYDCRPYKDGSAESCTIANPKVGTYYASIHAYQAFGSVTLSGTYQADTE